MILKNNILGDDDFPSVIGKSSFWEEKARTKALSVNDIEFPDFQVDPWGWRIIRHLKLNPFLGFRWIKDQLKLMSNEDKKAFLSDLKQIRNLFYEHKLEENRS